jgi:TolB-like protein
MKHIIKIILFTLAILKSAEPLVAQTKPSLAILPFTGLFTEQEGEAIALRLENNNDIGKNFETISRTSITNAILNELRFQRETGYTDSDTLSKIGKQLAADFVIAGYGQRLQDKNIILISIMNVETFQLIAGDYKEFVRDDDMDKILPAMINKILVGTKRSTKKLPKLAVPSLAAPPEITRWDSDILAQMLAIEIANSGKYVVLPRTWTINAALAELKNQRSGTTDSDSIKAIGKATNAEYVLAGTLTSLGSTKFIDVKILSVETGIKLTGSHEDYESIIESLVIIPDLAAVLTGKMTERQKEKAATRRKQQAEKKQKADEREAAWDAFWEESYKNKYNSVGGGFGFNFGIHGLSPIIALNFNTTLSLLPYTFFDFGFDAGFVHMNLDSSRKEDEEYADYIPSFYPYTHLNIFFPVFGDLRTGKGNSGLYLGGGAGYMIASYNVPLKGKNPLLYNALVGGKFGDGAFGIDAHLRMRFTEKSIVDTGFSVTFLFRFGQK